MNPPDAVQQVWVFVKKATSGITSRCFGLARCAAPRGCPARRCCAVFAGYGARRLKYIPRPWSSLRSILPLVLVFVDRADRVARVLREAPVR
ncbi:MAG: hypothetical protein U0074_07660 [Kouleothrix sp.]